MLAPQAAPTHAAHTRVRSRTRACDGSRRPEERPTHRGRAIRLGPAAPGTPSPHQAVHVRATENSPRRRCHQSRHPTRPTVNRPGSLEGATLRHTMPDPLPAGRTHPRAGARSRGADLTSSILCGSAGLGSVSACAPGGRGAVIATDSRWGISPRQSVEREVERRGEAAVIDGCTAMLRGEPADPDLIYALGGPPARWAVAGGQGGPEYWLRVWGARGLLWVWDDAAMPAVLDALSDEQWRVREMAAKICARHDLEAAIPRLAELVGDDPRARVRKAAERALTTITP